MKPVEPIETLELFPPLTAELLAVLRSLNGANWSRPTACADWTVKDVTAHLLGGNVGRLAAQHDRLLAGDPAAASLLPLFDLYDRLPGGDAVIRDFDGLVAAINEFNAVWVAAARAFSPVRLVAYLALTDPLLYQYFKALPAQAPAKIAVSWAGEQQSPNWFDIAREYTEKWLHQQHIREAVGLPVLAERQFLFPVLDTFLRALPHAYRDWNSPQGTAILIRINGEAGGDWTLVRQGSAWVLYSGAPTSVIASVQLDQDLAWRLFTKGVIPETARARVQIEGDRGLGAEVLHMVSIMA